MFRTGICSITHRTLSIDAVIELAVKCGLEGIEWGGDVHVPHGEIKLAEDVLDQTLAAGLLCPSYGSYYKVGVSEDDGLHFEDVLEMVFYFVITIFTSFPCFFNNRFKMSVL